MRVHSAVRAQLRWRPVGQVASLRVLHTLDVEDNMLKIDAAEVLVHQLGGLPNMRLVILADNQGNDKELTPFCLMYTSWVMSLID